VTSNRNESTADENRVIGLIPARGGSKGIPGKNIRLLDGHPLIAYSIVLSKMSRSIDRTIVSTDSEEIAGVARHYGAEVPFLRPERFAADSSPDIDFVRHFLDWFEENEGYRPRYIAHIRPTTPVREPELIDRAVDKIVRHPDATALRSVHETRESPYKLFGIENGYLAGLFPDDPRPEYYNLPRQAFPPVYHPNGYVDIIKSETVLSTGSLHGPKILSFVTPVSAELDTEDDFDFIEFTLRRRRNSVHEALKEQYTPPGEVRST